MSDIDEPFVKLTRKPLSGRDKAAILFCSLGDAAEDVARYFSTKELSMLRKAAARLEDPNPAEDAQVLESVCNWAKSKGFISMEKKLYSEPEVQTPAQKIGVSDPTALADVLRSWLSEGN